MGDAACDALAHARETEENELVHEELAAALQAAGA